jgi:hypothetical protein
MICSRWYFRAANAFPFSLHSPHPRCAVDCCCCGICTTPFIFTWRKPKNKIKKDMPKRENARKVKPCYNNTCIVVLVVCSTYIGKSAESNTPIFYTATAAFAPHPHTIRLGYNMEKEKQKTFNWFFHRSLAELCTDKRALLLRPWRERLPFSWPLTRREEKGNSCGMRHFRLCDALWCRWIVRETLIIFRSSFFLLLYFSETSNAVSEL